MSNVRQTAEQAIEMIQTALSQWEGRVAELEQNLSEKPTSAEAIYAEMEVLKNHLDESEKSRDKWKTEVSELEVMLEHKQAQLDGLKEKLRVAESGPDKSGKKEINFWRARIEKHEATAVKQRDQLLALKKQLEERTGIAETLETQVQQINEQLEKVSTDLGQRDQELEETRHSLVTRNEQAGLLEEQVSELSAKCDALAAEQKTQVDSLEADLQGTLDRLTQVQTDLETEKDKSSEFSTSLSENKSTIAELQADIQSRSEVMVSLQDEATQYNEVVESLQSMLAMKDRSNLALKRSVDNLRAYKLDAEKRQETLSRQIETLDGQLQTSAKLQVAEPEEYERVKDRLIELEAAIVERDEQVSNMSSRFKAQGGLVASMEQELETLRASQETFKGRDAEMVAIKAENEAKQQLIDALEADAKELRKTKKSLRKTESETLELKTLVEEEQGLIESLQSEVEKLRAELGRTQKDELAETEKLRTELDVAKTLIESLQRRIEVVGDNESKSEQQDSAMGKLMTAAKNQRIQIDKLQSEVNDWSRRYSELEAEYRGANPTHTCLPKIGADDLALGDLPEKT